MSTKKKPLIKNVFSDVALLYKNFIHWNISKFLFILYWFLLSFISILPFLLIYYIYIKIFWWDFSIFWDSIKRNIFLEESTFWYIIHFLTWFLSRISLAFYFILVIKLNNSYLQWKKQSIFKWNFFNFKLFWKYILLTLLIALILFVSIISFILILFLTIRIFWWIDTVFTFTSSSTPIDFWTIFSSFLFIILLLILFYLFYRTVFSYFLLVEEPKKWVLKLLKESFKKTKWFNKLLSFLTMFCIIWILYLPFHITWNYLSDKYSQLEYYYSKYLPLWEQEREGLKQWVWSNYHINLESIFAWETLEKIGILKNRHFIFLILFQIFKFLVVDWVFLMWFNSFYLHKLKIKS
jgi:hypothetical protein